jgi:hypothetical protein
VSWGEGEGGWADGDDRKFMQGRRRLWWRGILRGGTERIRENKETRRVKRGG